MAALAIIKDCGENYKYQGSRFAAFSTESGEEFRDTFLIPFLEKNKHDTELTIDFAGTIVYSLLVP
ncbi:MAG: hypothetical protein ACTTKL_06575 [Treponema sp.]